jgi:DNA-binding NtrC family response regulator
MSIPIRILIVEDSEDDALLLLRELRRGGYIPEHRRVETEMEMVQEMSHQDWDLVITDHNMPNFSSSAALQVVKESGRDVPIIVVSGSIGEDIAVQAMKSGAHDYIMKDNLARLVPAIQRELSEAENRHAHRRPKKPFGTWHSMIRLPTWSTAESLSAGWGGRWNVRASAI